jgi:hypothetical protein
MRFTVDLHHADGRVTGEVSRDGFAQPEPFHSWLDLLRILEMAGPPADASPGAEPPGEAD